MASPIPRLAPVTIAVRPSRRTSTSVDHHDGVDRTREIEIALGHPTRVMRRKSDSDVPVHIGQLRVMISRVRRVRDTHDEVDRLPEGVETELADDRVTVTLPTVEVLKCKGDRGFIKSVHTRGVPPVRVLRETR